MPNPERSPRQLRQILSQNLRSLTQNRVVTKICRDVDINRTQFNRYLSGESFPRPDALYRICRYFDVDANILLRALDEIPETAERIALRRAIQGGQLEVSGDFVLALSLIRAFRTEDTARFVLAQCAGVMPANEFALLSAELGLDAGAISPGAILNAAALNTKTAPTAQIERLQS